MIELGKKAKDRITGFEGIVTGRCQYLTSNDQYSLTPKAAAGVLGKAEWFDEGRLEVTGDGVSKKEFVGFELGKHP